MKKKSLLHVLLLVLACSAVCFAGCNMKSDPVTSPVDPSPEGPHTHTYDLEERVESTCVTQGHSEYYVCDGCDAIFVKNGEEFEEVDDLDSLALPLAAHTFNGISVDSSTVKTEYEVGDEFDDFGLIVTKTCSVEGCSGEKVSALDYDIVYQNDESVLSADMDHVTVKVGDWSQDVSVTVSKRIIALPTIADLTYNGQKQVPSVPVSSDYTVVSNDGATDKGEHKLTIKVTDEVNTAFKVNGAESATAEVTYKIISGPHILTLPASIANVVCCNEPTELPSAEEETTYAKVYCRAENGTFKSANALGGLTAGDWFVKYVAAATENYSETTSEAVSFKVVHGFGGYKQGKTSDAPVCACGESVEGEPFQTLASESTYVLATAESFAAGLAGLNFEDLGISGVATVGNLSYGDLDLGTKTEPNVANVATLLAGSKGEKVIKIAIEDTDGYDHTLTVPFVFVTEFINDWETLLYKTQMHNGHAIDACVFGEGEYYALGSDITATTVTSEFKYNDVTYQAKDYSSWGYAQSSYDDMKGFGGTVDGAGHFINNVQVGYCGIFASLKDATIKNLNITVDGFKRDSGIIANHIGGTTIENVNIIFNSAFDLYERNSGDYGVIVRQFAFNSTIKNVNVYAPGSKIKYIIGQGHYASSIYGNNTYSNIHCYAASAKTFTQVDALPEGSAIVVASADDKVKTQYFAQTAEKLEITLSKLFEGYSVSKVVFNGKKLGSGSEFRTEDVLELIDGTSKVGEYSLVLTLKKDEHTIVLPLSAAVASEFITSWSQLRYLVSYRLGVDAAFAKGEYYVLANDIEGGNPESNISAEANDYNGEAIAGSSPAWGAGDLNIQTGEEGGWTVAGFAGTLDGAGYTISGMAFSSVSLFGSFNGGTVKNLNMEGTWHSWGWGIFGGSGCMNGATIENVNVTIKAGFEGGDFSALLNNEGAAPANNASTGIFCGNQMTNTTIKNVVIHAEEIKVKNILAPGAWASEINNTKVNGNKISNTVVYVKDYITVCNGMTCINSREDLRIYTPRQTVELTPGETFSLTLPYGFLKFNQYGTEYDMRFYRIRIDGSDSKVVVSDMNDGTDLSMGGTPYKQQDLSAIPADNVLKFFTNEDGTYQAGSYDCEIEWTVGREGWNYGFDNYRLLVTIVVPEGRVPGTETPEGGDNPGTEVTDPATDPVGDTQTAPAE